MLRVKEKTEIREMANMYPFYVRSLSYFLINLLL